MKPKAFFQIIEQHLDSVYNFSYRVSNDAGRAEEQTREVFLRAYLGRAKLPDVELHAAWLMKIGVHVALGSQDGGSEYPLKELSRELFVDSFRVPPESRARQGPGVYDARMLQLGPWRVQVILLDTRSFRDPLHRRGPGDVCASGHYSANPDPEARLLGDAQWHWLAEQLLQPADLRLIVSGIQVIPDSHCWEKWGNFPQERARLFALIRQQRAEGVILLSGDRHFADISRLPTAELGYPLYEVTASGLNSGSGRAPEPNPYRVLETSYSGDHFGLLRIAGPAEAPRLSLQIRTPEGQRPLQFDIPLRALRFGADDDG